MKILQTIFLCLLFYKVSFAQTQFSIKGNFPQAKNAIVVLKGYTMTGDMLLSKSSTDAKGQFSLDYPETYVGAALLEIKDGKSVIVLLNHESFEMQWDNLEDFKTLQFKHSPENNAFGDGIAVAQNSEGKLAGLKYLLPLYADDSGKDKKKQWLQQEIDFQQQAFSGFLNALPKESYAAYYLKLRKFLQDMPLTASRYPERMAAQEQQFNNMDFLDKRLLQSGLYQQLLDGYFQLMESHGDLPTVYQHINTSTDAVLKSLAGAPELKQQLAEYLFKLFEKRSLFTAAEHLALAMLSDDSCQLDTNHEALFEQYRKMAKGNKVPELKFENSKSGYSSLSEIKNKYKLVVFGSSWCSKCAEEIPKINTFYERWKKENDLEVILVSLDTEKEKHETFTKNFPWVLSCDFKGWEGKAARDYYIFGTPTMYLLDSTNQIILKPISPEQIDAWLKISGNI